VLQIAAARNAQIVLEMMFMQRLTNSMIVNKPQLEGIDRDRGLSSRSGKTRGHGNNPRQQPRTTEQKPAKTKNRDLNRPRFSGELEV